MTDTSPAAQHRSSTQLAADPELFELWDRRVPFPAFDHMPDLDVVTHVTVERAVPGGYHYLHGSSIAEHRGTIHTCWSNGRIGEVNVDGEIIRGRRTTDGGMTWSPVETWAAPPTLGAVSINHAVLAAHGGELWGFFTAWNGRKPRTEIFTLNDLTRLWEPRSASIPGFVPFSKPMRMRDGNWIIGGENFWYEASVAVSAGDDWIKWRVVPIPKPEDLKMEFPETTLIERGSQVIAICRPKEQPTALVSRSDDCGQTWEPLHPSNFPMASAKPCAGTLSTGQHFLITNNLEEGRALLSIAVTTPGSFTFSQIWKIRHQRYPRRRLWAGVFWHGKIVKPGVGMETEWSYPAAVEHAGNLCVTCTQGKEDCVLSIIPVRALSASVSAGV